MILWGPPGVGKTTLARLMAQAFDAEFIALSAVLSGVKDIREAVQRAEAALRAAGRAHDPVRRRGAPLQQGAAGCVPALRRAGPGHLHRRDHREPVVRSEHRAAVARRGVRAASRCRTRSSARCSSAPQRGLPQAAVRRDARASGSIGFADGDARRLLNLLEIVADCAARRGARGIDARLRRATRWRATCAASTRAATRSTTRSRRCTSRCAAPTRTPRCTGWCACSTAAPIRSTSARRIVRMASEDIGLADPRALRARARRLRDLRAPGLARRRTGAGRGGALPGRARRSRTRSTSRIMRRARSSRRTARGRCRCTCATRRPS